MKKLVLVLLLGLMVLSACQAEVDLAPDGEGIGIDIVPGDSTGEQQENQDTQQQDAWWTNPIVIILLIVVVILLVVLVVSQTRRPTQ